MESFSKERIRAYILGLEEVLGQLDKARLPESAAAVVDASSRYLHDSKHYLEKGDLFTSLACVSYAEGLLDSLRMQGLVSFSWPRRPVPVKDRRILVGGVFDILHPGHLYFLKKASEHGRVLVIVARDNVVEGKKGRPPVIPEGQRLELVKGLKYVDEAYLGFKAFSIERTIEEFRPDVILLGPDQDELYEKVREVVRKKGYAVEVMKLKEKYRGAPLNSTSSIVRRIVDLYC